MGSAFTARPGASAALSLSLRICPWQLLCCQTQKVWCSSENAEAGTPLSSGGRSPSPRRRTEYRPGAPAPRMLSAGPLTPPTRTGRLLQRGHFPPLPERRSGRHFNGPVHRQTVGRRPGAEPCSLGPCVFPGSLTWRQVLWVTQAPLSR